MHMPTIMQAQRQCVVALLIYSSFANAQAPQLPRTNYPFPENTAIPSNTYQDPPLPASSASAPPPPPTSPPTSPPPPSFEGLATISYQRYVNSTQGQNMACGLGYLNEYFTTHYAAISLPLFGTGLDLCGTCISLACIDPLCITSHTTDTKKTATNTTTTTSANNMTFIIADSCKECVAKFSLVVAPAGAQELSGLNIDINPSFKVSWRPVPCAPFIQGGIKLNPSRQNSPNYVAINLSNFKQPVRAVSINGIVMEPNGSGYFEINSPEKKIPLGRPPYALVLLGVTGERLSTTVPALVPQDLGINFSSSR